MRHRNTFPSAALVGALAVSGALAVMSPASAAGIGCSVAYTVQSQWSGGFTANVTVTNLGDAISNWSLGFDFADSGQRVNQGWNATWSQSGRHVTATNAGWNGNLGTNASTSIGFTGSWTSGNPPASGFTLNGVACGGDTPTPPSDVLSQVHTVGRVKAAGNAVQYTWPGIYFEGRFRGTGVGMVFNDSANDYDVQIDGATTATLVTPGRTTYWVNDLANTEHRVRLVKRTESPWAAGEFGGLVAAPGGAILAEPTARTRQIEFIGDSFTAGYGNVSGTRDCSGNGGIDRNSNADLTFGALSARSLNADYQLIAQSGLGMVRNYNGSSPDVDFRTYYDRVLQAVSAEEWRRPDTWRPQLVVVGLGINDFSTALNPGERWATLDDLVAAYKAAYLGFLGKLRTRYGPGTVIVVSATQVSGTTAFADAAQQIVRERNIGGDDRVRYWYYDDPSLDRLGCDWHPSVHDHRIISGLLNNYIAGLPLTW